MPELTLHLDMYQDNYEFNEYGRAQGHDIRNDKLPPLPIYHRSFKAAESLATGLMKKFLEVLVADRTCDKDDDFMILKEKIINLKAPKYPDAVKIGLIGDSGTGRVSLLNPDIQEGDVDVDFRQIVTRKLAPGPP